MGVAYSTLPMGYGLEKSPMNKRVKGNKLKGKVDTWDHVHHGSFNFEEAHLVEVAAHVGNNLGTHLSRTER